MKRNLTDNARRFLDAGAYKLASIAGVHFYEHPTRGDNAPVFAITRDGRLIDTGCYDLGDFDAAYCAEQNWS